ncbi:hypothetical protein OESDEN_00845 [Oesophagostomum dentatum]|uniref:Uncharacterized protein n=1 Tax=Oesophagostomum dentatum TaxID=61180 RepID=A0A0B1TPK8_OESDE|nr:hypothetical protein OESDEN_00845 [Oesophagostomum dentatum]
MGSADKSKATKYERRLQGIIDCAPRADVVFIRFDSEPPDTWAIDQIDVDVTFQLGAVERHWYRWHFEHAILLPCMSWMEGKHVYQIGPRNGLFIEHNYQYTPKAGNKIRDWV